MILRIGFSLLLLLLAACSRLPSPEESGELVVGIRTTPAFYEVEGDTAEGFEHDLAAEFAKSLGVKPRFVVAKDISELKSLLASGAIHMAASLPLIPNDTGVEHSVRVRSVPQWIVSADDIVEVDHLSDLKGQTVHVAEGTAQAYSLGRLSETQRPAIVAHQLDEFALLEKSTQAYSGLMATDDIHLSLALNFFPELDAVVQLPDKAEFGWAFAPPHGKALREKAQTFIDRARKDGTLARIDDRYFGHIERIAPEGVTRFMEDVATKLPGYRRYFHQAQARTGIDWRLLAALAYQESKWDPLATSHTNVRGIMMLTEQTADKLGVQNRLDARESILAGSRYLAELVDTIPATAVHPDRLWLALSAYNLGLGHFNGARAIARGMNRNPDLWYDMKAVLPRLARPEVYARLKSGKARGGEAVIMVENIRTYYDILCRIETPLREGLVTAARPSLGLKLK